MQGLHLLIISKAFLNIMLIIRNVLFQFTDVGVISVWSCNKAGINPPLDTGGGFITGFFAGIWQGILKAAMLIGQCYITSHRTNDPYTHIIILIVACSILRQEYILLRSSINAGTERIIIKCLLAGMYLQSLVKIADTT